MPKTAHKVVVIGHRNPDTDSICSAIAYAELKNKTSSLVCEARRAGRMNQETEFVLKRFGVAPPRMCTDVNPKIRDVDYREMPGIPGSTSLRKAWEIMRDQKIDTLPITSADNELEGIITVKDIATANMDVFDTGVLATSRTTYQNLIMNTLGDLVYRWGHSSPVFRALYLVMDSLPDVVVCVVLIVCGVWLVKGPRPAKKPDASKDVPEDADFCEYHADEPDNAALLSSPVVNENEVTDDGTEHDE